MKTLKSVLLVSCALSLALLDFKAMGQNATNGPNASSTTSIATNSTSGSDPTPDTIQQGTSLLPGDGGTLLSDIGKFFTDAQPYFGTNGNYAIGSGVLVNKKHFGGYADISLFDLSGNGQLTIGIAGAYLDGNWYDASLAFHAGTTWNVPVLGSIYTEIESGTGFNFHAHHVVAQNFVLVHRAFKIGNWTIDPHGGVGNISDIPGPSYLFGVNVRPPGKLF